MPNSRQLTPAEQLKKQINNKLDSSISQSEYSKELSAKIGEYSVNIKGLKTTLAQLEKQRDYFANSETAEASKLIVCQFASLMSNVEQQIKEESDLLSWMEKDLANHMQILECQNSGTLLGDSSSSDS